MIQAGNGTTTFRCLKRLQVGDFLFTSGQVAINSKGEIVGEGDLKAQSRQIFENLKYILEHVGAGFEDVVKLTTYFTKDVTRPEDYWAIRREYFRNSKPASTGIQVVGLIYPELLLEVDVIVHLPKQT